MWDVELVPFKFCKLLMAEMKAFLGKSERNICQIGLTMFSKCNKGRLEVRGISALIFLFMHELTPDAPRAVCKQGN